MADAKAITSAVDFMAAVAGKTEVFTAAGVTVELRSLGFDEAEALMAQYGEKPIEMTFHVLLAGLVAPKLDEAQIKALRQSRPGPLSTIAGRIMTLSGMGGSEGGKSPLDGGGLSDEPQKQD